MTDAPGAILLRLLAARDPAFDPPPFDADVALAALGPSGAPLTPHRRLLELCNGAYLHDHALHLFGACAKPAWHGLLAWNARETWRAGYGDAADGLVFFAEDALGDQFAYRGASAEVVMFAAETGRVETVAPHFLSWVESMLEQPGALLPLAVMDEQRAAGHLHVPGTQLFAWPPLSVEESRAGVSIGHVDAVEAMRFRAQLARALRESSPGTRLQIDFADLPRPGDRGNADDPE